MVCSIVSVALMLVVGASGPSAAVVPLAPAEPMATDAWTVTALMWLAALAGGGALLAGLLALRRGWCPRPRRLLCAGVVAALSLLAVPPLGNGDIGSYAAYGRIAALGESPYRVPPSRFADDPVVSAVEPPWEQQVSVYGPVATASQYAAARLGGGSRAAVLRLLAAGAALSFAAVALLLHRHARDQRRAHVLWTCNPLLHLHLVASAHVDVLLCLLVVVALLVRRSWAATGVALALAVCVKITAGLSVVALLAADRRRSWRAVATAGVAGAGLYAVSGGVDAVRPVLDARSRVSGGTPWRWAASALETVFPQGAARALVGVGVLVLFCALCLVLRRDLPGPPGLIRTTAVLWLAYLFAAGYQLAWYDSVGFVLLALLPARSRWDVLLVLHTTVLTVAYLPGRVVVLPDSLDAVLPLLRSGLCPAVLLVLWIVALRRPAENTRTSAGAAPTGAATTG